MKSPSIRTGSVPHSQRLNSAKWFEEWELEQKALTAMHAALDRDEDDLFPVAAAPSRESGGFLANWPAPADPARDPCPAAGQIRLLPPDLTPGLAPPLYVAILSDWEDDLLLVAPFTSFQAPATGGELLTGRREPALAVLAAWATVSVSPFVLARSWYIDAMDDDLRTAAWQVFQHAATGLALPATLENRVGAPIVHPFDPRIRYQRRISALMKPIMTLTVKQDATANVAKTRLHWLQAAVKQREPVALAAESEAVAAELGESFVILETRLTLRTVLETDGHHCDFEICDRTGNLSSALDGTVVVTDQGESPGFVGGQTRVPLDDLANGFLIRKSDGQHLTLRQIPR